MISSATFCGTSAYESNSIEYDAWPEVLDLRSPTYPNISDSGTSASTTRSPERSNIDWTWPRRELMSPMTSPRKRSGVVTSTLNIGSSSTGFARPGGPLEALPAGQLDRQLGGVDVVVGAVLERELHVDHRVAGEHAELHGALTTLVDRRNVLARHATTRDGVHELVPSAGARLRIGVRLEAHHNLRELAGATGLLLVGVAVVRDLLADGLAVSVLLLADGGLDAELALHPVDEDLEVKLAHAGDDGLAGLLVGLHREGGVLVGEPLDRDAQLLLVALGLGLDRDLDHRGRERHRLQHDRVALRAEGL